MDNSLLLALGELVSTEISAQQLLERLVDAVAETLSADRATIYLLDHERRDLVSLVAHLPELKELRVPLQQGVAGQVARTERVVNIKVGEQGKQFWSKVDQETGYTTQSIIAGPMYTRGGTLIGVVQALNKIGDEQFTAQDQELFGELCKQAGALIEETTLTRDTSVLEEDSLAELDRELAPKSVLGEPFNRVVGRSEPMQRVYQMIDRVAPTDATVLIRGESGTGKSVIARAIHYNSARSRKGFVQIDSTTLPDTLIENELFGHEKGAFTGAGGRKKGRVELADGGTVFLDEIGDLPLVLQGKLLTLLQNKTFYRVGGTEEITADIRIVAATNRDLESLVARGLFREDLYYRLRVVQVTMPALRDRGREDIVALVQHFVAKAARKHKRRVPRLRADALQLLLGYSWPGNVRELEHCIESAVIFADREITPSTLSLPRPGTTRMIKALSEHDMYSRLSISEEPSSTGSVNEVAEGMMRDEPTLRELEARYIGYLLERHEGNRSECARILEIGRNTLIRKIKEYGLD